MRPASPLTKTMPKILTVFFSPLRTVVEGYNLPESPEEFLRRLEIEQDKLLDQANWMPGMIKLVHHLYKVRCCCH